MLDVNIHLHDRNMGVLVVREGSYVNDNYIYVSLGENYDETVQLFLSLTQAEQIAKAILSQLQQKQQQEMEEGEVSF